MRAAVAENIRIKVLSMKKNQEGLEKKLREEFKTVYIKATSKKLKEILREDEDSKDNEGAVVAVEKKLNKRGRIKTEPRKNKCMKHKLFSWFWFFRCILRYLNSIRKKIHKKIIVYIYGAKKNFKLIWNYFLKTFKYYRIYLFFLKFNLANDYSKCKRKATLRKKTRKRMRIVNNYRPAK